MKFREITLLLTGAMLLLLTTTSLTASEFPSPNASCEELLGDFALTRETLTRIMEAENGPGDRADLVADTMIELMKSFPNPNYDFAYFEQLFRIENIPFFLVAITESIPPGYFIALPPAVGDLKVKRLTYHLWIGVNGKKEADDLKTKLGISDEENLKRLQHTGVIYRPNPHLN